MQLFNQIIHVDFFAIVTLLYLAIFMRFNRAYDKDINGIYRWTLLFLAMLVISDNFDYYYSSLPSPSAAHPYFIMAGYIFRALLLLCAIMIIERKNISRKRLMLLAIPAVINACVILTAPVNSHVFWIDGNNVLHREILSYTPHVVSLVYFVIALCMAVGKFRQGYFYEGLILIISLAAILVAVISEIVLKTRGVLISAILLMLTFYYLYLHMEHFRRDNLTGVLNRMSFFADLDRHHSDITAFCELDLNNLKQINDTEGHAAGDVAIQTLCKIVLSCLPGNCYLYRMGGDEFSILFCSVDMDTCEATIERIRKEMGKTGFVCAVGIVEWNTAEPFENLYNLADRKMYEDKKRLKVAASPEAEQALRTK